MKKIKVKDSPIRYYDKQCRPIDLWEWAKLMENFEYRVIKQTNLKNYRVSTVWLGLNYRFSFDKDDKKLPLIFESMVFPIINKDGDIDYGDLDMDRYSTEKQALNGHEKFVKKYKSKRRKTCK